MMPGPEDAEDRVLRGVGPLNRSRLAKVRSWLHSAAVPSPIVLALLATGAGLVLRIDGLDRKSLWADEVSTARRVALPSLGAVFEDLQDSPFPPVYYALLWTWSRAWGIGDRSLRSLPALLGILALPATYLVWRPMIGRRAAAWAIVLLALNAYHIDYSQDAKMYSAVWLLASISSGALLNALLSDGTTRFRWLALYWCATALLPLISFVGVVPIGVQVAFGLIMLWWRPGRRWAVLDAAVAVSLAIIPSSLIALPAAMETASSGKGINWIPSLTLVAVPWELFRYLGVLSLGYRSSSEPPEGPLPGFLGQAFAPCTAVAAALLVLTMVPAARRSAARPGRWWRSGPRPIPAEVLAYLALWLTLPVAVAMATTLAGRPFWGVPRYLFGSAPALTIWLGLALGTWRRGPASCVAVALLVPNLASITFDRTYCTRIPWRQLAGSIAASAPALATGGATGDATNLADADVDVAIVALPGRNLDRGSLTHALRHDMTAPSLIRPVFIDIGDAILRGRPFIVVMNLYMGATQPDAMRAEVERITGPTWRCRRIFKEQAFQEPYTAMPTPYMRHSVEAWLCLPTPTDPARRTEALGPP